jgi:hypothetical protein
MRPPAPDTSGQARAFDWVQDVTAMIGFDDQVAVITGSGRDLTPCMW